MAKEVISWLVAMGMILLVYKFVDKDSLIYQIEHNLNPRQAILMKGMWLGESGGLSKRDWEKFQLSGLVHIVVVSGSNLIILIGGVMELVAVTLGRRKANVVGLFLGWGYVNLVGWQIPTVRAMLWLTVVIWAQMLGRKVNLERGLLLVGALMLVADPKVVNSYSFWLSMMAFVGNNFGGMLGVNLMIWPILGIMGVEVGWVSIATNGLILGLSEIVMVVGGLGLMIWPKILMLIGPVLDWIWKLTEWMNWGGVTIKFNFVMVVGYYMLIWGLAKRFWWR